jgi:hypothetical protein
MDVSRGLQPQDGALYFWCGREIVLLGQPAGDAEIAWRQIMKGPQGGRFDRRDEPRGVSFRFGRRRRRRRLGRRRAVMMTARAEQIAEIARLEQAP